MVVSHLPHQGAPAPIESHADLQDTLRTLADKMLTAHRACAHKDRVDLDKVNTHLNTSHRQTLALPDADYAVLRQLRSVRPLLLLPLDRGKGTVVGSDAVVMLTDEHSALKGLPANKTATMVAAACGLKTESLSGDCFVLRLKRADGSDHLERGAECAPQMLVERDWLEAAQSARRDGMCTGPLLDELARLCRLASTPRAEQEAPQAAPTQASGAPTMSWIDHLPEDEKKIDSIVTVRIRGLPSAMKARDVRVDFRDEWLRVSAAGSVVVDGKLFQPVNVPDCTWQFEDDAAGGRTLVVTLEKRVKMRWLELTRKD